MKKRNLFVVLLFCLVSSSAFADAIPPAVTSCDGKKVGDVCDASGAAGTCQNSTCSKLDYSKGSPPQGSIQYPCVQCVVGAAKPVETKPAEAKPTAEPKSMSGSEAKVAETKTGGCAVDPVSEGNALLGMVLLSGLALLARRAR